MDKDDNVLNFEMAMSQFSAMFPNLNNQLIESVLRKYNGSVAQTIEELLELSTELEASPSSSTHIQRNISREEMNDERKREYITTIKEQITESGSVREYENKKPSRDPCADDEKIALLIQNREFLRYLRHDPRFQRAIINQDFDNNKNSRHCPLPSRPPVPILLSSSILSHSPNGRLFNRKGRGEWLNNPLEKRATSIKGDELKPTIPEGPLIEYVDAENRESGWERLKAKLVKKPPEGSEQLPGSPLVNFSDEEMRKGVQGLLSKGGRKLIESLASRFNTDYKHHR